MSRPRIRNSTNSLRSSTCDGKGGFGACLCDAPLLESPYESPERNVNRRDSVAAKPMTVEGSGMVVLSDRPGMGYEFHFIALARTPAS